MTFSTHRTKLIPARIDSGSGHHPNYACDVFEYDDFGRGMKRREPGTVRVCCNTHWSISPDGSPHLRYAGKE